ncbi:S26 family signal peptidase [Paenibacillus solisilvae]|uniref:S26 family signal peptidase n=1 Tax=Paenibacillus solisilvae TaxID=2486751 RepID=A0ABW0VY94_9BACL
MVYYQPPDELKEKMGEYDISRVIGLPGEKVKINQGQIYINDTLLETFYGRAHRLGSDVNELKNSLKRSDLAVESIDVSRSTLGYERAARNTEGLFCGRGEIA